MGNHVVAGDAQISTSNTPTAARDQDASPDDISTIFQPYKLGHIALSHHVVLAPLARRRADDKHVPTDLAVEYYGQRASTPGTLLITESTYIAQRSVGRFYNPGVWNDEQIAGWAKVS